MVWRFCRGERVSEFKFHGAFAEHYGRGGVGEVYHGRRNRGAGAGVNEHVHSHCFRAELDFARLRDFLGLETVGRKRGGEQRGAQGAREFAGLFIHPVGGTKLFEPLRVFQTHGESGALLPGHICVIQIGDL